MVPMATHTHCTQEKFKSLCLSCTEDGPFRDFSSVLQHLDTQGLFHIDLGLNRMTEALNALNIRTAPCPVVQVVGTNGKGSTASFLHALAQAHGLNAGLYTSPHFICPTERIRLGHRCLPAKIWPLLANKIFSAAPNLTYFEFVTTLAMLAYDFAKPDLIILEAGLGGKNDATSAITSTLTCFTPIALDHQALLGSTLTEIATEKAHAMQALAITSPQHPEAMAALQGHAAKIGLDLHLAPALPHDWPPLGLLGEHQKINAATALSAWRMLCQHAGWSTSLGAEQKALASAFIAGRMQTIPAKAGGHPPLLIDGAHNSHGMEALSHNLQTSGIKPRAVIFGCMQDKADAQFLGMAQNLAPWHIITTVPNNPRAASPESLLASFPGAMCTPSLAEALALLHTPVPEEVNTPVLLCGSLYLLGEFYRIYPEYLEVFP